MFKFKSFNFLWSKTFFDLIFILKFKFSLAKIFAFKTSVKKESLFKSLLKYIFLRFICKFEEKGEKLIFPL